MNRRFVWDPRKAASNKKKHGVTFEDAQTAWDDPFADFVPDALHDDRWLLIGRSETRRVLVVVHIDIADDTVRLISARAATAHEEKDYEAGKKERLFGRS